MLAAIGVYGVLSYPATQRTHEIGVRMVLGAARRDVLRLVVRHGMTPAAADVIIGLAGALAVTQLIRSVLVVSPTDSVSVVGIRAVLARNCAGRELRALPARDGGRSDRCVTRAVN